MYNIPQPDNFFETYTMMMIISYTNYTVEVKHTAFFPLRLHAWTEKYLDTEL